MDNSKNILEALANIPTKWVSEGGYTYLSRDDEYIQVLLKELKEKDKLRKLKWRAITLSPPTTDNPNTLIKFTERIARLKTVKNYLYVYEFRKDGTLHSHILVQILGYPSDFERTCKSFMKACNGNSKCYYIDTDPHVQACETEYFMKNSDEDKLKLKNMGLKEFYSNYILNASGCSNDKIE